VKRKSWMCRRIWRGQHTTIVVAMKKAWSYKFLNKAVALFAYPHTWNYSMWDPNEKDFYYFNEVLIRRTQSKVERGWVKGNSWTHNIMNFVAKKHNIGVYFTSWTCYIMFFSMLYMDPSMHQDSCVCKVDVYIFPSYFKSTF